MSREEPPAWLRVASLSIWVAYLVLPAEGWGLFPGRPLGLLSTTALAVVCWSAFARGSALLPWRIVALALALKLGVGTTVLIPRGFAARYYANANFAGPAERSTEPADASVTRTDRRLRFGFDDGPDVPVAFFNDEVRFNFYRDGEPDRHGLPFSVTWQGFWRVTSEKPATLYVVSPGGAAQISVGDAFSRHVSAGQRWTAPVTLAPGFHRVTLTWSVPQGGARQFEAGRIVDGRDEPFDTDTITRRRADTLARAADVAVRRASQGLDVCFIAWLLTQLAGGLRHAYRRLHARFDPHDALTLAWAIGIGDAIVAALPALERMITLSGGDDWHTYETHARDIALNGLWMNGGAKLGQGAPFFQQPMYPYFLAACHWLFGDGLFGVYVIQRLFAAATIVTLWRIVAMLFDEAAGLAALVTAIVIVYEKFAPWSGILLTEVLFVPLVCFWMYTIVRFARSPSRGRAVAAGVVGGVATLTRSSLLLGWAGVVPALALAMGWHRRRLGLLAILVTTMIGVTSIATLRNWFVAHQFVAISSEGAVVLSVGNSPPPLPIPPAHKAQYERLGLEPRVQAVAEYARQQPLAFTRGLWTKAMYTLGWFEAMRPGAGTSTFYILTWIAALVGTALLPWIRPALPAAIVLIPLLLAASHFTVVVLFQPHVYGDRLIVPLYMLLVPYAAIPVILAARTALSLGRERAAAACWFLLCVALIARLLGGLTGIDIDLVAVAALVAGLCLAGVPELRPVRIAIYGAYAIAVAIWLVQAPGVPRGPTGRVEWLFLALALFSESLLAIRAAQRLAGWLLLGSAAIAAAWLVAHNSYSDAIRHLVTAIPPPFADVAVCAGAGGLCAAAAALALPARRSHPRRLFAYTAGCALAIAALHEVGVPFGLQRALLAGRVAAFGVAGAVAYSLVWIESAWPEGDAGIALATRGLLLGALVAALFGVDIADGGAVALFMGGLAVGAASHHSTRGARMSLPP